MYMAVEGGCDWLSSPWYMSIHVAIHVGIHVLLIEGASYRAGHIIFSIFYLRTCIYLQTNLQKLNTV